MSGFDGKGPLRGSGGGPTGRSAAYGARRRPPQAFPCLPQAFAAPGRRPAALRDQVHRALARRSGTLRCHVLHGHATPAGDRLAPGAWSHSGVCGPLGAVSPGASHQSGYCCRHRLSACGAPRWSRLNFLGSSQTTPPRSLRRLWCWLAFAFSPAGCLRCESREWIRPAFFEKTRPAKGKSWNLDEDLAVHEFSWLPGASRALGRHLRPGGVDLVCNELADTKEKEYRVPGIAVTRPRDAGTGSGCRRADHIRLSASPMTNASATLRAPDAERRDRNC